MQILTFLHYNSISMQGLKVSKQNILLYIYTLTQIQEVNIDFLNNNSISMRGLKEYKQNIYLYIDTFNTKYNK